MNDFKLSKLVFIVLCATTLLGCRKAEESREVLPPLKSVTVKVMTVALSDFQTTENVVGTVRSKTEATVEAKISGRIFEISVVPGQLVKAGELLGRLEANEIKARLSSAIAVKDQTQLELNRMSSLLNEQSITQQEYDIAKSHERVAQAAVDEARSMLEYLEVVAPFDGVIVSKRAEVGDLAAPGIPLFTMADPAHLRLEAHVPEMIFPLVKQGPEYSVTVDTLTDPVAATVIEKNPAADSITRTSLVKFDLPDTPGLRSGQFGRVAIPIQTESVIFVPGSAVILRGQMEIVFVVSDNEARLRLVRTGRSSGDNVEIISGLSDGEQIVVEPGLQLIDGQPVTLNE